MCTSQSLLSQAHDDPLYLLNHAYNSVQCGAPTVIREAPLEYQTMICLQKLYNQRLATMCVYHQLTPISRRHHIYAVGGRGGAILYTTWVCDGSYPVQPLQRMSKRLPVSLKDKITRVRARNA